MTDNLSSVIPFTRRLDPSPRQAPRCYNRGSNQAFDSDFTDSLRPHEVFVGLVAIVATLSFALLCIAIA
jgi:hypothetical protein